MVPSGATLWLKGSALEVLASGAAISEPLESGGVLMGYWAEADQVVVTHAIGPGPEAVHKQHSFTPDHRWQKGKIAEHYGLTNFRETYLGDWHSHPNSRWGTLSGTDRKTLRRIAKHEPARAPSPVMIVMTGARGQWEPNAWLGRMSRRVFRRRLSVEGLNVRVFN